MPIERRPVSRFLQVAAHGGQQIGVHHRGAGALVFLALGQHRIGRGHQQAGEPLAQDRLDALLVRGIAVAVDQADGDRLDDPRPRAARRRQSRSPRSSGSTTLPSAAMRSTTSSRCRRGTSGLGLSHVRSNMSGMRMRPISSTSRKPRVVISPVLAPRALQDGVGADRGAVQHLFDIRAWNVQLPEQGVDTRDHGPARIVRRGRDLALVQGAVARHDDDVGECSADIDRNPDA